MVDPNVCGYMKFFGDDYLGAYHETISPENTLIEVAFVQQVLRLPVGSEVLDLCCGHGRHSILLAKAGLNMTGLDLSEQYLEQAAVNAMSVGIELALVRSDMREIPFDSRFDAVINLFTSFGYLNCDNEDLKVLKQVMKALKPAGKFLVDLINRDWVASNNLEEECKTAPNGTVYQEHRELDLVNGRIQNSFTVTTPDGETYNSDGLTFRLYTLGELTNMLADVGLTIEEVYGGYGLQSYNNEARRMIVLAAKPA